MIVSIPAVEKGKPRKLGKSSILGEREYFLIARQKEKSTSLGQGGYGKSACTDLGSDLIFARSMLSPHLKRGLNFYMGS